MKTLAIALLLLSGLAFGNPSADTTDKTMARRVEVASQRPSFEPLQKPLRPERAYAIWSAPFGHWVYVLTDASGRLPKPLAALAPGTVVPHSAVGGNQGKRYRLGEDGKWEPTRAPIQRRVWELSTPPRYRVFLSAN